MTSQLLAAGPPADGSSLPASRYARRAHQHLAGGLLFRLRDT